MEETGKKLSKKEYVEPILIVETIELEQSIVAQSGVIRVKREETKEVWETEDQEGTLDW